MYMKRGGNIDTLASTQNYGDVAADDVSRFIPNTVSGLTEAIAVYDQQNQKVFFFIGEKILVFFKNVAIDGADHDCRREGAAVSLVGIQDADSERLILRRQSIAGCRERRITRCYSAVRRGRYTT